MFKSRGFITTVVCLLLCIMTAFMSIGYAAISDSLQITGTANLKEPKAIFITSIEYKQSGSTNINGTPVVTQVGYLFTEHTNYTLSRRGKVTFRVVVKNNSGYEQYFAGHEWLNKDLTTATVNYCTVSYSNEIKLKQAVANGDSVAFDITFTNNENSPHDFSAYVSYLKFTPDYDSVTDDAAATVESRFEQVLNGTCEDILYESSKYPNGKIPANQVLAEIRSEMNSSDTGGYIGNVNDSSPEDKKLIAAIFGDNVYMTIGNIQYPIYFLIKAQDVDQDGNADMVLYVTVDPLDKGASSPYNFVAVDALVYIYNPSNRSYLDCGKIFYGAAPVCNIGGSFGSDCTGNFHTHHWRSTEDAYENIKDEDTGNKQDGALDEVYKEYLKNPTP